MRSRETDRETAVLRDGQIHLYPGEFVPLLSRVRLSVTTVRSGLSHTPKFVDGWTRKSLPKDCTLKLACLGDGMEVRYRVVALLCVVTMLRVVVLLHVVAAGS